MKLMGADIGTIIMIVFSIVIWGVSEYNKSKKKAKNNYANEEDVFEDEIIAEEEETDDVENIFSDIFNTEKIKEQESPYYGLDVQEQLVENYAEEQPLDTPENAKYDPIDVLPDEELNNSFQNDVYEEGACSIDTAKYDIGEGYLDEKESDKISIKERIIKNKKDFIIFGEILKPKF
jgi:hypothetical protein